MNISVKIEAPGLVAAIQALAGALNNPTVQVIPGSNTLEQKPENVQALTGAKVAQSTPSAVPTAQPEQFYQQAPPQAPVNPPVQQTPPSVTQNFQQQAPMQQPTQSVPTSAPSYTMDQLAVAATQLVDAGKRDALLQLLASFGAQSMTALPKEQYGTFATKLREMGAKI